MIEYIKELHTRLEQQQQEISNLKQRVQKYALHSDPCDLLYAAFAKAQKEFGNAIKSKKNSFFKNEYADVNEMILAVRNHLNGFELSLWQPVFFDTPDTGFLYTIITHASGQWMQSRMIINLPGDESKKSNKNPLQEYGSYLTYQRRYMVESMLGIARGDEDDDGNSGGQYMPTESTVKKTENTELTSEYKELITPEQLEQLHAELENEQELTKDVLQKLKLKKLSDMPKHLFIRSLKRIQEIKAGS